MIVLPPIFPVALGLHELFVVGGVLGTHREWNAALVERLAYIEQIKAALGISGVQTRVNSWTHSPTKEHPEGAQIDLLIDRADNVINLCEMKYSHGEYSMTPTECDRLLHRRDVFVAVTGTKKSVHLTMVTPNGVVESPERHVLQSEVTLDDLFRNV